MPSGPAGKAACLPNVFSAYLEALDKLKLPYHEPQTTCIYGPNHWDNKSKAPYLWSGRKWFGCVPWIQFVGYQIRYDGLVRPRRDSIKKQATKTLKTVGKLIHGLLQAKQPVLSSRKQARTSLKGKLVAQSVGRIKGWEPGPRPMCWASGFKGLHDKAIVPGSLRYLDRVRSAQIRKFDSIPVRYGDGRPGQGVQRREAVGYAFSYEAQFTNLEPVINFADCVLMKKCLYIVFTFRHYARDETDAKELSE